MTNNDTRRIEFVRYLLAPILMILLAGCADENDTAEPEDDLITITVVGTNDVHGQLTQREFRGGLATLSGYIQNIRDARDEDGGAVLLIDAGDMWQGTMESNLSEGAAIVEAYNAMGYTAATVGNHEFDFGPVGEAVIPQAESDDPRGVLKQRASEAEFALLSANVAITATGERPDWPDIRPSVMINVDGVDVGIIGIITANALNTTISGNVFDLQVLPLAESIEEEATRLRADGADLVIVTAHAGTNCQDFEDPQDNSSCDHNGEIVRAANALPDGLVDHIVAGHVHAGAAHFFNGISITSAFANTVGFGRVDFVVNRTTGEVVEQNVFPPQLNCPEVRVETDECVWMSTNEGPTKLPEYEGKPIQPLASVAAITDNAIAAAAEQKNAPLGVVLESTFTTSGNPESTIANLALTALLEEIGADIVLHNVSGGIRAPLPEGELTYGDVYEMFPFDNRVTLHDFNGAEVRAIIANQATKGNRKAGFAGVFIDVACNDGAVQVTLTRPDGSEILDTDRVQLAANDFLATAGDGILSPVTPPDGLEFVEDHRLTRDALVDWFSRRGGTISPDDFVGDEFLEWRMPEDPAPGCGL